MAAHTVELPDLLTGHLRHEFLDFHIQLLEVSEEAHPGLILREKFMGRMLMQVMVSLILHGWFEEPEGGFIAG